MEVDFARLRLIISQIVGEGVEGDFLFAVFESLDGPQVTFAVLFEMAHFRQGEGKVRIEIDCFIDPAAPVADIVMKMRPVGLPGSDQQIRCIHSLLHQFRINKQKAGNIADFLEEL